MKNKTWLKEKNPTRLVLKANEEMGEITHAFNRQDRAAVLAEIEDLLLILKRLKKVI